MQPDPPQLLAPGEGERIRPGFEIKVGRPELVLTEARYEPGQAGPDLHIHRHHVDAFYVLEGELLFTLGGADLALGAGGFVLIPPEVVHTFRNPGPRPARYLNLHAPGMGFDEYLRSGFRADFDQEYVPAGGGPAPGAVVHAPGAGTRLVLGESSATIKAGAGDALGSIAVIELDVAPGFPGPVLHRHERMSDSFYVLEGSLALRIGDEQAAAGAGSYAFVPPGNAHTFAGGEGGPVRALNLMAPAGLERYLEEVAALGGPPDPKRMALIASGYDFRAV